MQDAPRRPSEWLDPDARTMASASRSTAARLSQSLGYGALRDIMRHVTCLNFVSAISSFGGIVSFVFFPCLLRLLRFLFLVLLRLLVLVLRTGAPARVGGCRSVLEPGSWSTPLVVRSFVVSSMMELRHREGIMVGD